MTIAATTLLSQQLGEALQQMSANRYPPNRYWVAYSGGVDSHVLLHAMAMLRPQLAATLHAIHVNHGLNPAAVEWAAHAQSVSDELDIPCHLFNLDATHQKGESPEAAARNARYHVFSQLIEEGDVLLTAHHREDQAETLLLQLVRGAGPHGLAAMPLMTTFSNGYLARPLLAVQQSLINRYAQEKRLDWIEDPSNQDRGFERNYLRHEIMPTLQAHWPAISRTVSRSAAHCAEAAGLLDELAIEDLKRCEQWQPGSQLPAQISLPFLQQLAPQRRRNLLRFWIKKLGLGIVSSSIMNQIEVSLINAKADAIPQITWQSGELRRYRQQVHAMLPLAPFDSTAVLKWDWQERGLELPTGQGVLLAHSGKLDGESGADQGLSLAKCEQLPMTMRFRQGGERCRLPGRDHRSSLKGLLQQAGVPPWQRDRIPLIYLGDQIAAVVGYFYCEPFLPQASEPKLTFTIH